jgi:iron complex outermembrane receptor protein
VSVLLCGSLRAFAASGGEEKNKMGSMMSSEDDAILKEVVVVGSRYEGEAKRLPAHVTVITEQEIMESNAVAVPDILKGKAGIDVRDWLGNSRNASIDIRGIGGETSGRNIVLVIDGRRVDDVDMADYDWTSIPLERIERIEILRGTGSVLYGDNASAGTINIITKDGGGPQRARVTARYGSYQMNEEKASLRGEEKRFRYVIDGRYLYTDGYRTNSYFRTKNAGGKLSYDFGDVFRLDVDAGYKKDRYGQPGPLDEEDLRIGKYDRRDVEVDDDTDNRIPYGETEDYYYQFSPEITMGDSIRAKLDYTYDRKRPFSVNYWDWTKYFLGPRYSDLNNDKKKQGILPQIALEYSLADHVHNRIVLGYDYYKYELSQNSVTVDDTGTRKSSYDNEYTRKSGGWYVQDAVTFFDMFVFQCGYRYEKSDFDIRHNGQNEFGTITSNDLRDDFDEEAVEAGITYLFDERSSIFYNYNQNFRFPKADEYSYVATGLINQELIPQRGEHHQIGSNYYWENDLRVSLCLFRLDTDNEIYFEPTTPITENGNINYDGKVRREGLELSLYFNPIDWLMLTGTYTYTDAYFESGTYQSKKFPGVPRHKYFLRSELDFEPMKFMVDMIGVGDQYVTSDYRNRLGKLDSYVVVNSRISYKWSSIDVFFGVNNLFNEKYSEYGVDDGVATTTTQKLYPAPERNFIVGITMTR